MLFAVGGSVEGHVGVARPPWLWLVLVVAPWCHPLAGIVGVLPTSWISRTRVLMLLVTCLLWEVQLPFWQLWNQSFGEHVSFTSEFSR